VFTTAAIAAGVAAVTVLLTTAFLMRYFRRNDDMSLDPFGYYCVAGGLGAMAVLLLR
jgi:undecaprenyl-diphosphatase